MKKNTTNFEGTHLCDGKADLTQICNHKSKIMKEFPQQNCLISEQALSRYRYMTL